MTIDRPLGRPLLRLVVAVPAIVALWLAVLAGATFAQPEGQAVAVFALGGRGAAIDAIVAAGGAVVDIRAIAVVAESDDPGFVGRLYRQGPMLVIGARGPAGCFNAALFDEA